MKVTWRMALATSLALSAVGVACKDKTPEQAAPVAETGPKTVRFDPKALERLGIKVDLAGSGAADYNFEVVGTLDYNYEKYAEIGAIADGRVTEMNIWVGEPVKKGDVLATLLVPDVAAAQAALAAAQAASQIAVDNQTREKSLLEKDLTTAREAELANAEAVRSSAELTAARARLAAMGASTNNSTSKVTGQGRISLISPIDGVVVRREAVLGRFVPANQTAFVVADTSELRAMINVYESDLPYFKLGADVVLHVDAHPGLELHGKVSLIEPAVGRASRALRAQITVPNEKQELRPGEFVRALVKLPENNHANALFVPAAAVQPLGDDDVVFVEREPGVFEVRTVKVERQTAQVVAIGEGLRRGEKIVVAGAFLLRGEVSKQ